MEKQAIIKISNLKKNYKQGKDETQVLKEVNVTIYRNDFTIIMGNSGSGKSTFLYCVSGMDSISSGSVSFLNYEIADLKEDSLSTLRKQHMGFVFQQMNLMPNLNIIENITIPAYLLSKKKKTEIIENAKELMNNFNIKGLEKRFPSQVSGGQLQRVAIARALINQPEIIFADEPTGALNSTSGKEVLDTLTSCNDTGQSILMVTHDVKAALRANRIIYISDGQIKGEKLLLPFVEEKNLKERENTVLSWLFEMGW